MLTRTLSALTWLPRQLYTMWALRRERWLLRWECRLLRERYERYLATFPEDEQRRIRAEMEAELAQARREILGDDPVAQKLVE